MHGLAKWHQISKNLLMLSPLGHSGSSGILAGGSWTYVPHLVHGSNFKVLRFFWKKAQSCTSISSSHSDLSFCRDSFGPCLLPNRSLRLRIQSYSDSRASSADLETYQSNSSHPPKSSPETSEDFSNFKPPPRFTPLPAGELLSEVPFHYWYSYADRPDNVSRKKRAKQSNVLIANSGRTWDASNLERTVSEEKNGASSDNSNPQGRKQTMPSDYEDPIPSHCEGPTDEHLKTVSMEAAREGVIKETLSQKEINDLIESSRRTNRQINIGWRGWGHNYIALVHSYWKRSPVCKIKCKGAVTLDMDFLCNKLEEKTGGKVIHQAGGVVLLYRGRDYDPKKAPKLPTLHQRRATPAHKPLPVPWGLTKDDVNVLRSRGRNLPALCKLAKNGVYVTLLEDVRKAFETDDLVRVNCQGFEARNFRALGAKLKKLVPCILISYEFEHILMWRRQGGKSPSLQEAEMQAEESFLDDEAS